MSYLDNMNVIELLECQSRLKVQQDSSARLVVDWLEPLLPEIGMSEEKYKRVLFENSIESLMFAREVALKLMTGGWDIPGSVATLVFFTRLRNTRLYCSDNDERIHCVFKNEVVFIHTCATGYRVKINGGAPTLDAGSEE